MYMYMYIYIQDMPTIVKVINDNHSNQFLQYKKNSYGVISKIPQRV